jgi:hypothetical protein
MRNGSIIKFYLPNLSVEDLSYAVECLKLAYDRGPKFAAWLMDALMDEQTRRLQSRGGQMRETRLIELRSGEWTARELGQALIVVNGMSFGVRNEAVGRLCDTLVRAFTAHVVARLVISEDFIHAIEAQASAAG